MYLFGWCCLLFTTNTNVIKRIFVSASEAAIQVWLLDHGLETLDDVSFSNSSLLCIYFIYVSTQCSSTICWAPRHKTLTIRSATLHKRKDCRAGEAALVCKRQWLDLGGWHLLQNSIERDAGSLVLQELPSLWNIGYNGTLLILVEISNWNRPSHGEKCAGSCFCASYLSAKSVADLESYGKQNSVSNSNRSGSGAVRTHDFRTFVFAPWLTLWTLIKMTKWWRVWTLCFWGNIWAQLEPTDKFKAMPMMGRQQNKPTLCGKDH